MGGSLFSHPQHLASSMLALGAVVGGIGSASTAWSNWLTQKQARRLALERHQAEMRRLEAADGRWSPSVPS
jgi:hypothetical protein